MGRGRRDRGREVRDGVKITESHRRQAVEVGARWEEVQHGRGE